MLGKACNRGYRLETGNSFRIACVCPQPRSWHHRNFPQKLGYVFLIVLLNLIRKCFCSKNRSNAQKSRNQQSTVVDCWFLECLCFLHNSFSQASEFKFRKIIRNTQSHCWEKFRRKRWPGLEKTRTVRKRLPARNVVYWVAWSTGSR